MKHERELLPDELVFEDDGHLGEVALSALADGEFGILPESASVHLGECDACTQKMGALAMLAEELGHGIKLVVAAKAKAVARPAYALPFPALAAAAVIALAGTLPKLLGLPAMFVQMYGAGMRSVPVVTRVGMSVAQRGTVGPYAVALMMMSTLVLIMAGLLVARSRPRTLRA